MDDVVSRIRNEFTQKYGHMMVKWYEAVDWQEPLILGLIATHVLLLGSVLAFRKVFSVQVVLFLIICGTIALSERINMWGHTNWKLFATQNYFDKNGVFMGIFVAGPLLAIGFIQLISNMHTMAHLVVVVKRHEYKQHLEAKKSKKQQ
ncbi:hypothetical protein THRCLA_00012 [Thraustotheca clavata]|uniref:Uncharacterized protein n=1 Tax=Thraustotheca clavata TaxID=74557 RepID=A0A1W0ACJ6_9STRA|nr:hypothetical protein THRCLA_00012 [Thraustotheca clavata]